MAKTDVFYGYPRPDGQVGVRNNLLLLSATLYANPTCERVAQIVPGAIPIVHPLGRCQVHPDIRQTVRCLVGHGKNPNAGAVIVIDHFKETGCMAEDIAHEIAKTGKPVEAINIRGIGGAIEATAKALRLSIDMLRQISGQQRQKTPVSKLLFSVNCGTSDGTSGLSSNKATGVCSDMIVAQGGRTIQAETTEMMGGEDVLLARCVSKRVGKKLLAMIDRMEKNLMACGEDIRGSQPTGDNIEGGLSTIEEKSLGAIVKGGTAPIIDVVDWACPIGKKSGLYLMDSPGHGAESITGIAAAGAPIMVFSTGGGHTINHPLMVTIRVTGNTNSYKAMVDTMELSVEDIFEGASINAAGKRIYTEVLETANGKLTKGEILREWNGFAINRCGPST